MKNQKIAKTVVISTALLMGISANAKPFEAKCMDSGYKNAKTCKKVDAKCGEGKCGEGKCGAKEKQMSKKTSKKSEAKCGEGKCGGSH